MAKLKTLPARLITILQGLQVQISGLFHNLRVCGKCNKLFRDPHCKNFGHNNRENGHRVRTWFAFFFDTIFSFVYSVSTATRRRAKFRKSMEQEHKNEPSGDEVFVFGSDEDTEFSETEKGTCCFCERECNWQSQACGECMRSPVSILNYAARELQQQQDSAFLSDRWSQTQEAVPTTPYFADLDSKNVDNQDFEPNLCNGMQNLPESAEEKRNSQESPDEDHNSQSSNETKQDPLANPGRCCYCGSGCNPLSQACGKCMRSGATIFYSERMSRSRSSELRAPPSSNSQEKRRQDTRSRSPDLIGQHMLFAQSRSRSRSLQQACKD
jgi:hypothetical protein